MSENSDDPAKATVPVLFLVHWHRMACGILEQMPDNKKRPSHEKAPTEAGEAVL